jgi:Flp pilus assembly protein CpaB
LEKLAPDGLPPWVKAARTRRIAAALLAVAALALAVRGDPSAAQISVVVAARDLAPGIAVAEGDIALAPRRAADVPEGAETGVEQLAGRTVAGAIRAGEIVTDVRTLTPRLAEIAAGSADSRVVPVRLADPGVAALLRAGDRVDVLAGDGASDGPVRQIALAATVLLVSAEDSGGAAEPVVLLALPADQAQKVAAASLTEAITVTLR